MKTPDDIKKGLELLSIKGPEAKIRAWNELVCVHMEIEDFAIDTLAFIQQLEARNNVLYYTLVGVMHTVGKWVDGASYDPDADVDGSIAINMAAQAREVVLKAIDHLESKEKHAYWMGGNYCSNCHAARSRPWAEYIEPSANTFCHVCGARMDAKEVQYE